jgi:hypothetical protein
MNSLESTYLFLFIFGTLDVLRTVFRFISSLSQNQPQKLVMSNRELIFLAASLSYCITYLIKN